jgi:hypothetical protein
VDLTWSHMMNEDQFGHFVEILAGTPKRLCTLLNGLHDEQLRYKPSAETFSLKEHVLHLRDIEIEGHLERMKLILAEELPVLEDIDGTRLAQLRHYQLADVARALKEFAQARKASLAYLSNMDALQWRRKAVFGGREVTLLQQVSQWVAHDGQHLAEVETLRDRLSLPAA